MILLHCGLLSCDNVATPMKTNSCLAVLALCLCLLGCADGPKKITTQKVNQLRPGQTTEHDLVRMFGKPTDRVVEVNNSVTLSWFHVSNLSPLATIPSVGLFLENRNVAQTLTAHLDPAGRLDRYRVSSIKDEPGPAKNQPVHAPNEARLSQ